jgi:hypothetical protein
LVFERGKLNADGSVRDDALYFNAKPGQFVSTHAAADAAKNEDTYVTAFTQDISTRDQGWPAVEHDKWLFLRCKFADYPNLEDPLFAPDTYIQNEFGRNGIGMGGFVDYFKQITYGKIDYNIELAPDWYPTIPTTQYKNGGQRVLADSTCAENYGHGITAASFSGSNYIGPTYAGIIALWNKQHDAGNGGGNLTVLDSGRVGTDMSGAAHEALHAYGLAHPHADLLVQLCIDLFGNNTVYCDIWDPMGASQVFNPKISTYNLPANNPGMSASLLPATVIDGAELNAPNRLQLNAVPPGRILTLIPQADDLGKQQATVTLAALEKPEANGYLVVKILHCDPIGAPKCDDPNQFFTVKLRVQTGWDINIPEPTVLIHEVFTGGRPAYVPGKPPISWWMEYFKTRALMPAPTTFQQAVPVGEFVPGSPTADYTGTSALFTLSPPPAPTPPPAPSPDPSSPVSITVQNFDAAASTATVLVNY